MTRIFANRSVWRMGLRCCGSSHSLCERHSRGAIVASPTPIISKALKRGVLSDEERFAEIRAIRHQLLAAAHPSPPRQEQAPHGGPGDAAFVPPRLEAHRDTCR